MTWALSPKQLQHSQDTAEVVIDINMIDPLTARELERLLQRRGNSVFEQAVPFLSFLTTCISFLDLLEMMFSFCHNILCWETAKRRERTVDELFERIAGLGCRLPERQETAASGLCTSPTVVQQAEIWRLRDSLNASDAYRYQSRSQLRPVQDRMASRQKLSTLSAEYYHAVEGRGFCASNDKEDT